MQNVENQIDIKTHAGWEGLCGIIFSLYEFLDLKDMCFLSSITMVNNITLMFNCRRYCKLICMVKKGADCMTR